MLLLQHLERLLHAPCEKASRHSGQLNGSSSVNLSDILVTKMAQALDGIWQNGSSTTMTSTFIGLDHVADQARRDSL